VSRAVRRVGARGRSLPNLLDRTWQTALFAVLERLATGELSLALPDGRIRRFAGREPGPKAEMHVHEAGVARRLLLGGGMGLAESYMDRSWDTPDLDAVLDLGVANIQALGSLRLPVPLSPVQRAWHRMRDNDVAGARRNIEYHYDLGNDFYRLWLDPTMAYSAACFDDLPAAAPAAEPAGPRSRLTRPVADTQVLERAQRRKWDRVLELVQPGPNEHLLDIGCGWGGFAMHAAETTGCRVTGITLSPQQAALARRRVEERGLTGQVDIRLRDYRSESGTYDAVASIEMFEAVGERWWPVFFAKLRQLLRPGARAGLQVITIGDRYFERYRSRPDFTQRYIFPGGMLPSPGRFAAEAAAAGLALRTPRFFGADYARTLVAWARRFESGLPEVRRLGFDERFIRMWRYYLSYCRAGFSAGRIDVMQVGLER
jgi:cyclopropane-fatty-acyl-phospholipid synthase